jgi:hypothetical protein
MGLQAECAARFAMQYIFIFLLRQHPVEGCGRARVVNGGKLVEKYIRGAQSREIICSLPWTLSEFFFHLRHDAHTLHALCQ